MRPTKSTYAAHPVANEGIAALGAAERGGVDAIVPARRLARGIDAEMRRMSSRICAEIAMRCGARLFDRAASAQDDTT